MAKHVLNGLSQVFKSEEIRSFAVANGQELHDEMRQVLTARGSRAETCTRAEYASILTQHSVFQLVLYDSAASAVSPLDFLLQGRQRFPDVAFCTDERLQHSLGTYAGSAHLCFVLSSKPVRPDTLVANIDRPQRRWVVSRLRLDSLCIVENYWIGTLRAAGCA